MYLVLPPASATCSVWLLVFIATDWTRPFCRSLTKLAGELRVATVPATGVTLYLASSCVNAVVSVIRTP